MLTKPELCRSTLKYFGMKKLISSSVCWQHAYLNVHGILQPRARRTSDVHGVFALQRSIMEINDMKLCFERNGSLSTWNWSDIIYREESASQQHVERIQSQAKNILSWKLIGIKQCMTPTLKQVELEWFLSLRIGQFPPPISGILRRPLPLSYWNNLSWKLISIKPMFDLNTHIFHEVLKLIKGEPAEFRVARQNVAKLTFLAQEQWVIHGRTHS